MIAEKFLADSAPKLVLIRTRSGADGSRRARRQGRDLARCQVAIARDGKIAAMKTFGRAVQGGVEKPATDETVFVAMSATKAITSSALWILIQEGKI